VLAQHAVSAPDLSDQLGLLQGLANVSTELAMKYSDLKAAVTETVRQFPGVKAKFTQSQQATLNGDLASSLLVLLNHARRLKDPKRYQEACSKATAQQEARLEQIRALLVGSSAKKKKKKQPASPPASPAISVKTEDLLAIHVPQSPATSAAGSTSCLAEANMTSPIPVKKAQGREAIKRPAASLKKPAAALEAKGPKPSKQKNGKGKGKNQKEGMNQKPLANDLVVKGKKMHLMEYKSTGACAVRLSQGRQLLQVVSKKGAEESYKLAKSIMQKLQSGESLGAARAWKKLKLGQEKSQRCCGLVAWNWFDFMLHQPVAQEK
jgi:hypothetical protein